MRGCYDSVCDTVRMRACVQVCACTGTAQKCEPVHWHACSAVDEQYIVVLLVCRAREARGQAKGRVCVWAAGVR